jgi:hypothetical protein
MNEAVDGAMHAALKLQIRQYQDELKRLQAAPQRIAALTEQVKYAHERLAEIEARMPKPAPEPAAAEKN